MTVEEFWSLYYTQSIGGGSFDVKPFNTQKVIKDLQLSSSITRILDDHSQGMCFMVWHYT